MELHPYLKTQLANGQVSHAYLFSGQHASAQADLLAAALLCQNPLQPGQACGVCPACRNLQAGTHPDCRTVEPKDGLHRVEQMRELVASASLSPVLGKRKVCILPAADKMTEDGTNTLLKLLEEPPENAVFLLQAAAPDALLPTILSRCQLFCFGGNAAEVEPELSEELLDAAETLLAQLPEMPLYQVLIRARDYEKDREQQKLFFFALLKLIHSAVKGQHPTEMSVEALLRSANMLETAIDLISRSVNQKMLTDVVYLRLWQSALR